jgi:methionine-rich copper-binding protein CopC
MRRVLAHSLLLAAAPVGAVAHGVLERTDPRAGASVKTPPAQVRLWFTGALEPAYSRVRVLDAAGKRVDLDDAALDPANAALLRVSVPALAPGRYRVVWRVLSVDSHVTEGDFSFRVEP